MTLPSQRNLFSIPRDVVYLNAATMTPQSKAVEQAGVDGVHFRANPFALTEQDFFDAPEKLRGLFAKMVDAEADDVALISSASYGMAIVEKNIKLEQGQNILVLDEQFPSNVYTWRKMAAACGGKVITVPAPADDNWTAAVLGLLDESVGLVALPNGHWAHGAFIDLVAGSQKVKALGAKLVLDLTQSLGAYPFSVKDVDADFVISSAYKWMFSPYGVAMIYVNKRYHDGEPLEENWLNREGSENFKNLVDYQDGYQKGARRFDVGERQFFLMKQAVMALEQILEWGVENIRDTIAGKNRQLAKLFAPLGFHPADEQYRMPHLMGLRGEGDVPAALISHLKENKVSLSYRGTSIRVAPHVYVDDEDLDNLARILARY